VEKLGILIGEEVGTQRADLHNTNDTFFDHQWSAD
jgi:hypothetical protein